MPLVEAHAASTALAQLKIFIFKYSKLQYTFLFCCYLLDVYTSFLPPTLHYLTKSQICVVLLETPKNSQPHVTLLAIFCRLSQNQKAAAFSFIVFHTTFNWHLMTKQTRKLIVSAHKLNLCYISAMIQVFVRKHIKGLAAECKYARMQVSRKQGISHFMTFSQILKCLKKR
jgi:hypothetical protein